jgi:hypothetical protein
MARFTLLLMLTASLAACASYEQAAPVDPVAISDHGAH